MPSTWNAGPRDAKGQLGPYEASLIGNPIADPSARSRSLRTIHSFDPCLACAIHTFDPEGNEIGAGEGALVVNGLPGRIAVIGLGNVLMGDDAFGPWVAQVLLAGVRVPARRVHRGPRHARPRPHPYLADLEALVLVDTVRSDAAAGTIRSYRREALLQHAPQPRLSPHDPGVKEALLTAEFAGMGPREVLLVGAVPLDSAMGVRLSDPLRAAVPRAVGEVLRELQRLGRPATRRSAPQAPDIWWEAPPALLSAASGAGGATDCR